MYKVILKRLVLFILLFIIIFFIALKKFYYDEKFNKYLISGNDMNRKNTLNIINDDKSVDEQIESLEKYLNNNDNIESLENCKYISVIKGEYKGKQLFNLISYNTKSQNGFGTLENTWIYLQIISNDKIELYNLYDCYAYEPVYIKVLETSNDKKIIAIGGVTNVSKMYTGFVSFWEYYGDNLIPYKNINLNTIYNNCKILDNDNSNEFYIEYFNNDTVNLLKSSNEIDFYYVKGNNINIRICLKNDIINIIDNL